MLYILMLLFFIFLQPPPLKPLVYTNYYNPPTNTAMTGKVCCEKHSNVNIYYFRVDFFIVTPLFIIFLSLEEVIPFLFFLISIQTFSTLDERFSSMSQHKPVRTIFVEQKTLLIYFYYCHCFFGVFTVFISLKLLFIQYTCNWLIIYLDMKVTRMCKIVFSLFKTSHIRSSFMGIFIQGVLFF